MKKLISFILTFAILATTAAIALANVGAGSHRGVYTVQPGDSLYLIAKRHGTTLSRIQYLNPYHGDLIYPGQNLIVRRSIYDTGLNHITYRVSDGDTVGAIAERFGVSISTISALNPDISLNMIYPGQKISILADFTEHIVVPGDTLHDIAQMHGTTVELIQLFSGIDSNFLKIGEFLNIPIHEQSYLIRPEIPWTVELSATEPTITHMTYVVRRGDTPWNVALRFGIPVRELLYANDKTLSSQLQIGQVLLVPIHHIPTRSTPGSQFGEYLDWWTEAQYLFPINEIARIIDLETEQSFRVRRTMGENHANVEPLTTRDTETARRIWGGYSWDERAVVVVVDGRRIAASATFFPRGVQYVMGNDFDGHFNLHFRNSSWHSDGRVDEAHQENVRAAAGR